MRDVDSQSAKNIKGPNVRDIAKHVDPIIKLIKATILINPSLKSPTGVLGKNLSPLATTFINGINKLKRAKPIADAIKKTPMVSAVCRPLGFGLSFSICVVSLFTFGFTSKKTTAANPAERRANPMPSDDDSASVGEVPFVVVGLEG